MSAEKDVGAFRSIGEVAAGLDVKPHVLRYWESQFAQLRPLQRKNGRRYYRPEDVQLIGQIHQLVYGQGLTLRGAKMALSAGVAAGGGMSAGDSAGVMPVNADVFGKLRAIRAGLAAVL
ncbi:MAG: hypothetical protein RLY97_2227 [Pseudomonadota bacterium]